MIQNVTRQIPLAAPFLAITAVAVVLFYPTWLALLTLWLQWDQVLAHGLAAFAIFLALTLVHPPIGPTPEQRANQRTPGGGSWLGAAAFALMVTGWLLFSLVNINTLTFLMLPALLGTLCWAILGFQAMVRWLPYLALFSLSLPFWSDLTGPLVDIASVVVGGVVGQLGMPALIEGNSITLPYGRLVIEDGCSGIRYFAISILLASCIAILNDYRLNGWIILIAIAMLLGMVANWIRILGLVIIAYQSDMQSSLMDEHELYGWLIYAAICLPALYFAPTRRRASTMINHAFKTRTNRLTAAIVVGLAGLSLVTFYQGPIEQAPPFKMTGSGFIPADFRQAPIAFDPPEQLERTTFWHTPTRTWVGLATFQRTHSQEKLVPYLPDFQDTRAWRQVEHSTSETGPSITQWRNRNSQRQVLQTTWYQVGSYQTQHYWMAKLLQIPATLQGENRFALVNAQRICSRLNCEGDATALLEATESITLEGW